MLKEEHTAPWEKPCSLKKGEPVDPEINQKMPKQTSPLLPAPTPFGLHVMFSRQRRSCTKHDHAASSGFIRQAVAVPQHVLQHADPQATGCKFKNLTLRIFPTSHLACGAECHSSSELLNCGIYVHEHQDSVPFQAM